MDIAAYELECKAEFAAALEDNARNCPDDWGKEVMQRQADNLRKEIG